MDTLEIPPVTQNELPQAGSETPAHSSPIRIATACLVAAMIPGAGHAVLAKWDRAIVFFSSITLLFFLGLELKGRLFGPEFTDLFSVLKFAAEAGSGLFYWVGWLRGLGPGQPSAYTYDFGNVYLYVSGLLNMLVVIDVFDIGMGRKP